MFIAMNRFQVKKGAETAFETVWATRESYPDLVGRLEHLAFRKGLLLLGAGKSSLRLAPPLIVDDYDVDTALAVLDQCLSELD